MRLIQQKRAIRVSVSTIIGNAILSAFKLAAGILASSGAMLSDAVHSLSDVLSTVIVIIGVRVSGKAPDKEHPYGHERMECVAALGLAVLLCATGAGIGWAGISSILAGRWGNRAAPGTLALIAAAVSIIVKEGMYWYTRAAARALHSSALLADAWHHRSDALSSIGSFAGILGARLGLPVLDPIASVVICLFIIKASVDIFRDAIGKMTDRACDDGILLAMRRVIERQAGVLGIDQMKTRLFGDRVYLDVEIRANRRQPLEEAHRIAHRVHDAVEREFPLVKHCMVHVNPGE